MLPRLLAAAALRGAANATDDALGRAGWVALRPLDAVRGALGTIRHRFVSGYWNATSALLDRVLSLSGVVAGCGCDGTSEDECRRDGGNRACGCACHVIIRQVLPS